MFKHASHTWLCGLMVAGALIVVAVTGKDTALLPAAGCVVMMVVLMQMMGGSAHGSCGDSDSH